MSDPSPGCCELVSYLVDMLPRTFFSFLKWVIVVFNSYWFKLEWVSLLFIGMYIHAYIPGLYLYRILNIWFT